MDECLEEVRKAFEQLDHWLHVPFFEFLAQIPKGNENDLYDLAEAWGKASSLYSDHAGDVRNSSNDLFTIWSGDGAAQSARNTLNDYATDVDGIAGAMGQMQGAVQSAGLGIETNKYMAIINLIMLLITLIQAIATLIVTFGASALEGAGAIAVCREALELAFKELLKKLASLATKEGWQALAKVGLERGAQFVAFTVATKAGITAIEAAEGHMTMDDLKTEAESLPAEVVDSFFTGFIGGPLSLGMHGMLPEALAMGGGQIADNAFVKMRNQIFGNQPWAKQWGITNDGTGWLTGVGPAALFGGVMGGLGSAGKLPEALGSRRAGLGLRNLGLSDDPGRLTDPSADPALDPLGDTLTDPAADPNASDHGLTDSDTGGGVSAPTADAGDTSTHTSSDTPTTDETGTYGQTAPDGHEADTSATTTAQDATSSHDPGITQDATGSPNDTGSGGSDSASDSHDGGPTQAADQQVHSDDGGTGGGRDEAAKTDDPTGTGDTTTPDHVADTPGDHTADAPGDHAGSDASGGHSAASDASGTDTQAGGGSHDANGGDANGGDANGSQTSRSDQTAAKPEGGKPHFWEWRKRFNATVDSSYQARIAHEFAGHSAKDPVTLSHDTIQQVVDHRPEDLDAFGRRLRGYVEDHFTTRDETGALVVMDDAAIRTTLHTLAGFPADRPPSEPSRDGRRSDGETAANDTPAEDRPAEDRPSEDKPADDKPADGVPIDERPTEPASDDGDPEESWVSAADDGRPRTDAEWGKQLLGRILERGPDTDRPDFRPGDPVSDAVVDRAERFADRVLELNRKHLHGDAERLSRYILDNLTATDPDGTAHVLDHDAITQKLTELYGDRTPDQPEPSLAHPIGDAESKTQTYDHVYVQRDPTDKAPGNLQTTPEHFTAFRLDFDKFEQDFNSPEAIRATHDAAHALADAMHDVTVDALRNWLLGDEKKPPAEIGHTATAVMLSDGTVHAASSMRNSRGGGGGKSFTGDPGPEATPRDYDILRNEIMHPLVKSVYDEIPERMRSAFAGMCGEPTALSDIARTLEEPFLATYLGDHGVTRFDDLSPEDKADYAQKLDAYLRQKIAGAHIVSYHAGGPDQGREQYPCGSDDIFIEKLGMNSDYVERIGQQLLVDKANGVVAFVPEGDPLREIAPTLASARDGSLTIVGHGTDGTSIAFGDEKLGPVEVNRILQWVFRTHDIAKPDDVSLVSCVPDSQPHDASHRTGPDVPRRPGKTGASSKPLGRGLGDRMDTDVVAARKTVWISNRGRLITGPHDADPRARYRAAGPSEPWTKYLTSGAEEFVDISDYVKPSGIHIDLDNAPRGETDPGHDGSPGADDNGFAHSDDDETFVQAGFRRPQPEPWVADYEAAAHLHESVPDRDRAEAEIERIIDEHGLRDGMPGAAKRYADLGRFLSEPAHRLLGDLRGVQHDADPARAIIRKMLDEGDLLDRVAKAEISPVADPTGALRDVFWVQPKGWDRQWRIGFTVEIESGLPADGKMVDVIGTDVGQHFKIVVKSDVHDPAELGRFSDLRTRLTAALEDRIRSESGRAPEGNSPWVRRTKAGADFGGTAIGSAIADLLGDAALAERPMAGAFMHLITQGHFSRAAKLADARTDHLKSLAERFRIDRIGPDELGDSIRGLDDDIRDLASHVGVDPDLLEERPPDDPSSSAPPPSGPPPEPGEQEREARELIASHRDAIKTAVRHIDGVDESPRNADLRVEVPHARDPRVTLTVGETDGPYSVNVSYDGNRHFTLTMPEDMLRPDADPAAVSQALVKAFEKIATKEWELDATQDSAATVGGKASTALATQAITVASGEAKSMHSADVTLQHDTHHHLDAHEVRHDAAVSAALPAVITLAGAVADTAFAPFVAHNANAQGALRKEHDAAQMVPDVPKAKAAAAVQDVRRAVANTLRIIRIMNYRDGRGSDPMAPDADVDATPITSAHRAMTAIEEANLNRPVTIEKSPLDATTTRYVIRHSALNKVTLDIKEDADADRSTLELPRAAHFVLTVGAHADPAETARITHELAQTIIDKRAQVDSIPEELRRTFPATAVSLLAVTATAVETHSAYALGAGAATIVGKLGGIGSRHVLGTRLADRVTEHAIAVMAPGDVTAGDLRTGLHDLATEVQWQEGKTRDLLTDHIEKIDQELAQPDISRVRRSELDATRQEAADYLRQIPTADHEILAPIETALQRPDLQLPHHAGIRALDADSHLYQLTSDRTSASVGIPGLGGTPRASRTIEFVTDDGGRSGEPVRIRRTNADTHLTIFVDRSEATAHPADVMTQVEAKIRQEIDALHGNKVPGRTVAASTLPGLADAALTSATGAAVGVVVHATEAMATGGTSVAGALAGAVVDQAAGRGTINRRVERTAVFDALAKLRTAKPTPERTAIFAERTREYTARLNRVGTIRSWLGRRP